ncbi:leucine carboxy methyltransferase [Saccharomycopsis crataegensis]|uniref:Leucine carboxyl methyltransferase 1 n=1 Tax=Saccharomycopsis crataegensis TaxID=43959 RepID=A0AAV5QRL9_9ASCO|nr:leucine carboxy methyltransferase [Saccharomycopsis crataegensis]
MNTLPNPAELRDRNVRHTDFDALSSRLASIKKGYLSDRYVEMFVEGIKTNLLRIQGRSGSNLSLKRAIRGNFSEQSLHSKFPIINRGTYLRTVAIDTIVSKFVDANQRNNSHCQIISIGAGSDTRAFKWLKSNDQLTYVEADFLDSTKLKASVIVGNQQLSSVVSLTPEQIEQELSESSGELHGKNYHLVPLDLRQIDDIKNFLSSSSCIDPQAPTLIISECVLCYIDSQVTYDIMRVFKSCLQRAAVVLYEPIGLNDSFGKVMVSNLKQRGISLPTLQSFPTIESQQARLMDVVSTDDDKKVTTEHRVFVSDMNFVYDNWVSTTESARISRLELLDELEEWILLSKHYCLAIGTWWPTNIDEPFQEDIAALKWQLC